MEKLQFSVSEFIALTNQTLEYAYPEVTVEGEIASFKVNQGKYVFFDLKDSGGTVGCFMTVWQLRVPVEDGMKVLVTGAPKLTQWGKFSLTARVVRPSGQGALKKSFDLLKDKLEKEGLFALERKRVIPQIPHHIAVISSTQAAGYADFMKLLNDRWGGMQVDVAHVQVQGHGAAEQIIQALQYFNEREHVPEVIVIVRGGGSADDLAVFNDELLVRAISRSRVPVMTGIGHETDQSLADLVADRAAVTPSNAAQILVPDRKDIIRQLRSDVLNNARAISGRLEQVRDEARRLLGESDRVLSYRHDEARRILVGLRETIAQLDPDRVLKRGYALLRGDIYVGAHIEIETKTAVVKAEVLSYDKK